MLIFVKRLWWKNHIGPFEDETLLIPRGKLAYYSKGDMDKIRYNNIFHQIFLSI